MDRVKIFKSLLEHTIMHHIDINSKRYFKYTHDKLIYVLDSKKKFDKYKYIEYKNRLLDTNMQQNIKGDLFNAFDDLEDLYLKPKKLL